MATATITTFSPPDALLFNVGSTDSAAENAVKLAKKAKKQRLPIKRSFWNSVHVQTSKAVTRKSVLARSSVLRQVSFRPTVVSCWDGRTNCNGQTKSLGRVGWHYGKYFFLHIFLLLIYASMGFRRLILLLVTLFTRA